MYYVYTDPKHEKDPVYRIGEACYSIRTLELVEFDDWEANSLFRLSIDLTKPLKTAPVYVRTEHGDAILELGPKRKIRFLSWSTRRLLEEKIRVVTLMMVPRVVRGEVQLVDLPPPKVASWSTVRNMFVFGVTFNELFGREKIRETDVKLPTGVFAELYRRKEFTRLRVVPKRISGNVIVVATSLSGERFATVIGYDKEKNMFSPVERESVLGFR